jgi:hypothetical protein
LIFTLTNLVAELKPLGPTMRTSWLSRVETSITAPGVVAVYRTVNEYNVPPATVTFVVVALALG